MARSGDRGATWRIDRLAGPFDLSTAEPVGGSYLGDFQSLVATKGGFEAAFTLAGPFARTGATDIFRAAIPNLPRGGS